MMSAVVKSHPTYEMQLNSTQQEWAIKPVPKVISENEMIIQKERGV